MRREKIKVEEKTTKEVVKKGELKKKTVEKIPEEKMNKIKKEIKDSKKSKGGKKLKDRNTNIFKNIILAILFISYFFIIMIIGKNIPVISLVQGLKSVIIIGAIASIALFEIAFKKDSSEYMFYGIEVAFVDAITVWMLDLYSKMSDILTYLFYAVIVLICVYYLGKSLYFVVKARKQS